MSKVDTSNSVYKLGLWSAGLTALLSIAWSGAFAFQFAAGPSGPWEGVEAAAASFDFLTDMVSLVFALPLSWAFVVMMVSLHIALGGVEPAEGFFARGRQDIVHHVVPLFEPLVYSWGN